MAMGGGVRMAMAGGEYGAGPGVHGARGVHGSRLGVEAARREHAARGVHAVRGVLVGGPLSIILLVVGWGSRETIVAESQSTSYVQTTIAKASRGADPDGTQLKSKSAANIPGKSRGHSVHRIVIGGGGIAPRGSIRRRSIRIWSIGRSGEGVA